MLCYIHVYIIFCRSADESEVIRHPANGKKWIEDLNFNCQTQDGESIITIPFNMFLDDTATHKSRRWMPLHCIQMQLSGNLFKYIDECSNISI